MERRTARATLPRDLLGGHELTHYLALALRNLRKTPGAAAINVLTLALGLVAAVTAYAFVAFTERSDAHFPNVDRTYLLRSKQTPVSSPFKSDFGLRVPEQLQIVMLLSSFAKPVVVANLVTWPVAFVAARIYLKQFPDPISLTPLPFVGSLALMLAIACLAVGTQTWRAARLNPAEVLHHE